MYVGTIYQITLGTKHTDRYLCIYNGCGTSQLRRIRMPKSKIDAVRLPEIIHITEYATAVKNKDLK